MAIACDLRGDIYLTGYTRSFDFPVSNPIQESLMAEEPLGHDAFVSKLARFGDRLIWSTYLGGGGDDSGRAIVIDAAGTVYVAGHTSSDDFPVVAAFQPERKGEQPHSDAFVSRIAPPFIEWHLPSGA